MAQVIWTPGALEDLESIGEYIGHESVRYARETVKKLREAVRLLQQHPMAGRTVPEAGQPHLRELILDNYRIIYFIPAQDTAYILAVHHAARHLDADSFEDWL